MLTSMKKPGSMMMGVVPKSTRTVSSQQYAKLGRKRLLGNQAFLQQGTNVHDNQLEKEADRIADQTVNSTSSVMRHASEGMTRHSTSQTGQRYNAEDGPVHSVLPEPAMQQGSSSHSLSVAQREFFEPRLGHDFSNVRLHADAQAAAMASRLHAEAFTIGRDIYFGANHFPNRTTESNRLLAHELSHVAQQSRSGPAIQPKLKITGKDDDVNRTLNLLNSGLGSFYHVSTDKAGEVKIDPVRAAHTSSITGPEATQKALANRLWAITTDPKDVLISVTAGSTTLVGSYATGDIDITDIEALGVSSLIHEIEEQYQKQAKGKGYGSESSGAHGEGIKAESEVKGAKRGPQKIISLTKNADGTISGVFEIPYTYPDGTVKTMVMTVTSNNVSSVTWK